MDVIFDGIGTEFLSLIIGSIIGGTVGYKIGSKSKQKQENANNSNQIQNSINVAGGITANGKIEVGSVLKSEKK